MYTIGPGGASEPKAVEIKGGITDNRYTQVVSGDLKVGETVIVGLATTKADASKAPGAPSGGPGGRRF